MPSAYVSGDNLGRTQEEYDAYWKYWNDIAQKNSFLDSYFNRYAPGGLTANQKSIVENQLSKIDPAKKYTRDASGQLVASGEGDRTGQQEIDFLMNMYGLKRDDKGNFVSKTYAGPAEFGNDYMPLDKFRSLWESIGGTVPEAYKSQTQTAGTNTALTTPATAKIPTVGAAQSIKSPNSYFKAPTPTPAATPAGNNLASGIVTPQTPPTPLTPSGTPNTGTIGTDINQSPFSPTAGTRKKTSPNKYFNQRWFGTKQLA